MPGPAREVTRQTVYETMLDRTDPREPWTVKEIAEMIGCSESTVYDRLRELHALGEVRTKQVGPSRIWWTSEEPVHERTVMEA